MMRVLNKIHQFRERKKNIYNSKLEKNIGRIQQRINIVSPVICDVQNSCFNLGKLFTTISLTIHGGAIALLISLGDEKIFSSSSYFIAGIVISFVLALIMPSLYNLNISEYAEFIIYKKSIPTNIFKSLKRTKFIFYVVEYIFFYIFLLLFYGNK